MKTLRLSKSILFLDLKAAELLRRKSTCRRSLGQRMLARYRRNSIHCSCREEISQDRCTGMQSNLLEEGQQFINDHIRIPILLDTTRERLHMISWSQEGLDGILFRERILSLLRGMDRQRSLRGISCIS